MGTASRALPPWNLEWAATGRMRSFFVGIARMKASAEFAEKHRAPLPPGTRERKLRFLFPLPCKAVNTAKRMSEEAFRMQSFPCSGATRISADFALFSARKPDRSIFYYTTNERYLANVFHEIMRAPRRTPVPCGAEENRVPLKSGRFVFAAVSLGLYPGAVLSVFSQVREKQC